jgi:hypothetical protein
MKALSVVQLAVELSQIDRFNMIETLKQTGLATNGRFIFPLPKAVAEKVIQHATKRNKNATNRPVPLDRLKDMFQYNRKPCETAAVQSHTEATDDGHLEYYTLASPSHTCRVPVAFFNTIRKYCPKATTFAIAKGQPVVFAEDGKNVALLMPFSQRD